jgi:hypothetical protein
LLRAELTPGDLAGDVLIGYVLPPFVLVAVAIPGIACAEFTTAITAIGLGKPFGSRGVLRAHDSLPTSATQATIARAAITHSQMLVPFFSRAQIAQGSFSS